MHCFCLLLHSPYSSPSGFSAFPSLPFHSHFIKFSWLTRFKFIALIMISQLTNLLSLAQMSLVSCRLIYLTPYLAFPEGTIDPQLGVQARLILSQQVSLLLFYGFRRKKQDSWFKDKGPYYSQHSEQREHRDIDVSTLTPQTPQG